MIMNSSDLTVDFPDSFLSSTLKYLLVDFRNEKLPKSPLVVPKQFVTRCSTFNWNEVASQICNVTDYIREKMFFNMETSSIRTKEKIASMYSDASERIWPVIREAGQALQMCDSPPSYLWSWTNCEEHMLACFKELRKPSEPVSSLKAVLILSSVFERALGNVYLTKQRCVPFLLRDLIASEELHDIFGLVPMSVAHILLGTPLALNVRNVCWHGFPASHEIHPDIAAGLLVLIGSFGQILVDTSLSPLPKRPQVTAAVWEPFLDKMQTSSFPSMKGSIDDIRHFLKRSRMIPDTHKQCWTAALELFYSGNYGESLVMLIPALEHLLRCAFCAVNKCPSRVLVAEQHTFYTTMDEILAPMVFYPEENIEHKNALRSVLGDKILQMLIDIFESYSGPRIRDKLSHGECELNDVPGEIVNYVLCIALVIFWKFNDFTFSGVHVKLMLAENHYVSKFHPASQLINQSQEVVETLEKLIHCPKTDEWKRDVILPEISKLEIVVMKNSVSFFSFSETDISGQIDECLRAKIDTLYRSKSDLEVIAILQKTVSNLKETCLNTLSVLCERYSLCLEHKLRSRQRCTYARMVTFLPSLHAALKCVLLIVLLQLHQLPSSRLKYLRQMLKYAENMASCSSPDRNRWMEMEKLTSDLCVYSHNSLFST